SRLGRAPASPARDVGVIEGELNLPRIWPRADAPVPASLNFRTVDVIAQLVDAPLLGRFSRLCLNYANAGGRLGRKTECQDRARLPIFESRHVQDVPQSVVFRASGRGEEPARRVRIGQILQGEDPVLGRGVLLEHSNQIVVGKMYTQVLFQRSDSKRGPIREL